MSSLSPPNNYVARVLRNYAALQDGLADRGGALSHLIVGGNDHDIVTLKRQAWAESDCLTDLVIAPGAGRFTRSRVVFHTESVAQIG